MLFNKWNEFESIANHHRASARLSSPSVSPLTFHLSLHRKMRINLETWSVQINPHRGETQTGHVSLIPHITYYIIPYACISTIVFELLYAFWRSYSVPHKWHFPNQARFVAHVHDQLKIIEHCVKSIGKIDVCLLCNANNGKDLTSSFCDIGCITQLKINKPMSIKYLTKLHD